MVKKNRIAFHSAGYNKKYSLTHPWVIIANYWREVKWFIQRGLYGVSDCDVWSFDYYLCEILASGLEELSHGISYPGHGEMNTYKKWRDALKLNAKRFQNVIDYEDEGCLNDKNYSKGKQVYHELDEAWKFISKWFGNLWD